jgi:heme-degrading monooxygenase HmoA
MFVAAFAYEVAAGQVTAFEAEYGPAGGWSELFSRVPGYLGTELLSDQAAPGRYLVLDRWSSVAARDAFLERWGDEYAAHSARCENLYTAERDLGRFRAVKDFPVDHGVVVVLRSPIHDSAPMIGEEVLDRREGAG